MPILALDLGTYLGYAVMASGKAVVYGTKHFVERKATKKHAGDPEGTRFMLARQFIGSTIDTYGAEAVHFEDVHNHTAVGAAHVYGGLRAVMQMACIERGLPTIGHGVGTIKKFWTGRGNEGKTGMIERARALGYPLRDDEDDTADALAIGHLAESLAPSSSWHDLDGAFS